MDRGGAALNRVLLRGPALLWAGPLAFLALFYAYPLAGIVATSFAREADGLLRALASPATGRVVLFTLGQAAASTALTLLVGSARRLLWWRATGSPARRCSGR